MGYKAIISKIKVAPHPDSKYVNIQVGYVKGYEVIVGINIKDNDLGILFLADGCLSREFCLKNKLYRKHPDTQEPMGGYLEENGRIKCLKFGGVKSSALWMPIESLNVLGAVPGFVDGDEIDSVNGVELCKKYYTPATLKQMSKNKQKQVKHTLKDKKSFTFPKHFDTAQFKFNKDKIPQGSLVYITEKLHGTSARMALVETEKREYSWWQRKLFSLGFGKWFTFKPKVTKQWEMLVGSRNVVLNDGEKGFYESDKFRWNIANQIKDFLMKNEVVYGEIVGYTDTNALIMSSVATAPMKDKAFTKKWGDHMIYKYGNAVGHCDFYVYRISNLTPDGVEIDLSWEQVKKRCKELGVKYVPEMPDVASPVVYNFENPDDFSGAVDQLLVGSSLLDDSHIREGVCLRVENSDGMKVYKYKSWEFGVLEGYLKSDDSYLDREEVA